MTTSIAIHGNNLMYTEELAFPQSIPNTIPHQKKLVDFFHLNRHTIALHSERNFYRKP